MGEDAAQRLEELDQQRADFEGTLDIYLAERKDILDDAGLSQVERQETIAELRVAHFPSKQIRRVEAIERIWDAELE